MKTKLIIGIGIAVLTAFLGSKKIKEHKEQREMQKQETLKYSAQC